MSRGILVLAQNSNKENYTKQATVLAQSIKLTNPNIPISVITNDIVLDENLFDRIIPIPFSDLAENTTWKVENRWKVFLASPYEETLVLDTDMLVLQDISHWWSFFEKYELYFTTTVKTYRDEIITNDFYRKTFTKNNLPNLYTGMYYFKKCKFSEIFFETLKEVMHDWEKFYDSFLTKDKPTHVSVDVCAAITCELLNITHKVTNTGKHNPSFVHMKSQIQNWEKNRTNWLDYVNPYLDQDCFLKIGNTLQHGVFHYTEKDFLLLTDAYKKYRKLLNYV